VIITLACASLAAFALARRKIRGWQLITVYFLCATTVPIQLFLFPLYFVYAKLGIVGNFAATALILSAINLPISIFLLRAYVLTIPQDVDDAAFMDGANPFQTFWHVILPLTRPGLITVAIIVFLNAWNEFLITSTFQKGRSNITMTLGYLSMNGTYATDQGALMAGAFILVAPIIVFFLLLQRFFISGMTSGAVKG
jgi:raffinose/stachyose/melibiose transport system permease protein